MKMKKRLVALLLVVAMVLSMAAPAFASSDIGNLPADQKAAIEQLLNAGVVGGYPDGTFKPNGTLTRGDFAKFVVNAKGLAEEKPATPTFKDAGASMANYGFIEAAAKAKIIQGFLDGTFGPTIEITKGQAAVIALRIMGKSPGGSYANEVKAAVAEGLLASAAVSAETATRAQAAVVIVDTGLVAVSPVTKVEFSASKATLIVAETFKFVADAKDKDGKAVADAKITYAVTGDIGTIAADGTFTAAKAGTGKVTATSGAVTASVDVTVAAKLTVTASVVSTKSLKVVLNSAAKDATVAVKKGDVVIPVTATWNSTNTEVTLVANVALSVGEYTVTVNTTSGTVTVAPERIETVTIAANGYRDATVNTTVDLTYTLKNQYGEDITKNIATANLGVSASLGAPTVNAQGTLQITGVAADKTTVSVTLIDKTFAKSAVQAVTVLAAKSISEITLSAPTVKTGKTQLEAGVTGYVMPYTAKDQYGNDVTLATADLAKITFISSNAAAFDPAAVNAIQIETIGGKDMLTVDFIAFSGPKDVTITAIVNATGKSSSTTFKVYGTATMDAPELVAPTTRFGSTDADFKVELKVKDQYGNYMKANDIAAGVANLTITSGNTAKFTYDSVVSDGTKASVLIDGVATGSAVLTVTVNATGKSTSLNITVVDPKYPASITLAPSSTLAVSGAVVTLKATFKDQYGDEIKTSANLVKFTVDNADFGAAPANTSVTDMAKDGVTMTASAYDKITKVTAKLYKADGTTLVDTKELTLTSVKADAALTYAVEAIGTISTSAAGVLTNDYAKEIKVSATDASGNKVALAAGAILSVTTSNATASTAGLSGDKYKVAGNGTADASVILFVNVNTNAGVKSIQVPVTVSKEAPVAQSIAAKAGTTAVTEVSITANNTVADLLASNAELYFEAKDQYGTTAITTTNIVSIFITDNAGVTTKLAVDGITGLYDFTFAGAIGDKYTVTAITANGLMATAKVTLK